MQLQWRVNKRGEGQSAYLGDSWSGECSHIIDEMHINFLSFLACAPTRGILGTAPDRALPLPGWLCALASLYFIGCVLLTYKADTGGAMLCISSALIIHLELVLRSSVILLIALVSYVYVTNYHTFSVLK